MRQNEHRAAAAVTARALADSPTAVAIYGDDPLDGLAGLYGELGPFFGLLPSPQMAAFTGDCVIAAAGVAPPGGCIGSFVGAEAAQLIGAPEPAVGDPARAHVFWAHWAQADLAEEHWHLGPVGVEPGFQGRGIGGALMRAVCAWLDEGSAPGVARDRQGAQRPLLHRLGLRDRRQGHRRRRRDLVHAAGGAAVKGLRVHLLDGTYELFRHFYGAPPRESSEGGEVGAVRGVVQSVLSMFAARATHVGVATDHVIESFRNDLWPGYKTGEGVDEVLMAQFPLLEAALVAMGVVVWPMVELEADDALASAAAVACRR